MLYNTQRVYREAPLVLENEIGESSANLLSVESNKINLVKVKEKLVIFVSELVISLYLGLFELIGFDDS